MKITSRLRGTEAPSWLARRVEARLETGAPARLEGRFKDSWLKDGRDRAAGPGPEAPGRDAGDLRRTPRPEPRAVRNRS